jgi:hypothetical protein
MVLGQLSQTAVCFYPDFDLYQKAASAMPAGAAGPVPALCPPDPVVGRRWLAVIREQYSDPLPPRPGDRLVLTVAGWAEGPAGILARMTGSRLIVCPDLDTFEPAVDKGPERAVMVVAPAAALTVARIMAIDRACAAAGRTWGVVTGRGPAELAFAVAKTVLSPRPGLSGTTVVDAPSHRESENEAAAATAGRLTDPALFMLIRSHGEGGHAKLPGTVVCGLLDDTEFPAYPSAGCSVREHRCKRASSRASVLFAREIRAPVVAFVCCNGFNVAGELYPSPVSMALGMTEGWVSTLISPVRPLIAPDSMVTEMRELLSSGTAFGEVVQRMNKLGARIGQPHAFVLHGDPCGRLTTETGTIPTVSSDVTADTDWIGRALVQTERGARVLRSMRAWLGNDSPDAMADLDGQLAKSSTMLLSMLKWSESLPSAAAMPGYARSRILVRSAVSAWDRTLCPLLLESREVFDAYDLGHYDQQLLEVTQEQPCRRCATPIEVSTYGGGRGEDDIRRAESCVICGPIAENRRAGLRISIVDSTLAGGSGDTFSLRVRVNVPPAGPVAGAVHLRMRFFDKAVGGCVADQARVVSATDQDVGFSFVLPGDLGVDLHSVRVAAVSGCDIAYARVRFTGQPARSPG